MTKLLWSAFAHTDLAFQLRVRGITTVALSGLVTGLAVESTGRDAFESGFAVRFATDAMYDLDAERHRNSLERVFPMLGRVQSSAAIAAGASSCTQRNQHHKIRGRALFYVRVVLVLWCACPAV